MLCFGDHEDRETFLAVVGVMSLVLAGINILFGAFYWWACRGDVRRGRDWRTIRGRFGAVGIAAPVMLRLGMLTLVLGPAALGLYDVVDQASYDSLLYGD